MYVCLVCAPSTCACVWTCKSVAHVEGEGIVFSGDAPKCVGLVWMSVGTSGTTCACPFVSLCLSGVFLAKKALGKHVRCIAYDSRGHGETRCGDESDFSVERLAADGLAVIHFYTNKIYKEVHGIDLDEERSRREEERKKNNLGKTDEDGGQETSSTGANPPPSLYIPVVSASAEQKRSLDPCIIVVGHR